MTRDEIWLAFVNQRSRQSGSPTTVAEWADLMLAEYDRRFPVATEFQNPLDLSTPRPLTDAEIEEAARATDSELKMVMRSTAEEVLAVDQKRGILYDSQWGEACARHIARIRARR